MMKAVRNVRQVGSEGREEVRGVWGVPWKNL